MRNVLDTFMYSFDISILIYINRSEYHIANVNKIMGIFVKMIHEEA
jgi:hypothetical protein